MPERVVIKCFALSEGSSLPQMLRESRALECAKQLGLVYEHEIGEGYTLSPAVRLHWAEDGDHGLAPRKASGRTTERNWAEAISAIAAFLRALEDPR